MTATATTTAKNFRNLRKEKEVGGTHQKSKMLARVAASAL